LALFVVALAAAGAGQVTTAASARAELGTITTVAGGPAFGPAPGTSIGQSPSEVTTYATLAGVAYIYVADDTQHVVRRVAAAGSAEQVVAGDGAGDYAGDGGPATSAGLDGPESVAVDHAGDLFIGEDDDRVRFVPASSGTFFGQAMSAGDIYTIAGNGVAGFSGDGGPASSAEIDNRAFFGGPAGGVAVDAAGDLAIADSQNNRVRFVPIGSGAFFGKAMTGGDIYTIAGDGSESFSGDKGPATSAALFLPAGVGFDQGGDLAIADTQHERVRFVPANNGTFFEQSMSADDIYTIAGDGKFGFNGDGLGATSAELSLPLGVALDVHGNLAIADADNSRVRFVPAAGGPSFGQAMFPSHIYTIAGNGEFGFKGDGVLATTTDLAGPQGVAFDGQGDLAIADAQNERMRFVPEKSGTFYGQAMSANDIYTVAGNGSTSYSGDGGPAVGSEISPPAGVAVNQHGDIAIADFSNCRIRFVPATSGTFFGQTMSAGDIYTIAGDGGCGYSGDGIAATSAEINEMGGIALDHGGDLLIADRFNNRIRFVPSTSGTFFGQAMSADDIYTIAGDGTHGFLGDDGPASSAELNQPGSVAVDQQGDLAIADAENNRIRFVPATSGTFFGQAMSADDIYTIAGDGTAGFSGDGGPASSAELHAPYGLAFDAQGDAVIGDSSNDRIRVVAATSGTFFGQAMSADDIYTIAGDGTAGFAGDGGSPTSAELDFPSGVAVDQHGDVVIADEANNRVRFIPASPGAFFGTPLSTGDIYTIAGDGVRGLSGDGGPAVSAELAEPDAVALDGLGDVLIGDANSRVRFLSGTIPGPAVVTSGGGRSSGPASPGAPPLPSNVFSLIARSIKSNGRIVLTLGLPDAGRLKLRVTFIVTVRVKVKHHRSKRKRITVTYASGSAAAAHGGRLQVTLKPGTKAAREIGRGARVKLKLVVTFTPTGGAANARTFTLTIKRTRKGRFQLVR